MSCEQIEDYDDPEPINHNGKESKTANLYPEHELQVSSQPIDQPVPETKEPSADHTTRKLVVDNGNTINMLEIAQQNLSPRKRR